MTLRTGPRPKCSGPQLPRDHSFAKPSAVKAQIPGLPAPPSQWLPARISLWCYSVLSCYSKKLRCQLKDIACDNFNRACSKGVRLGRIRWIFRSRRWQQNFANCRSSVLKVRNAGGCKGVTTSKLTESCKTALSTKDTKEDLAFMIHKNHVRNPHQACVCSLAVILRWFDHFRSQDPFTRMFHDAGLEKLQRRTSQDEQSDQIQDSLIFLVYITHQVLN